MRVWLTNDKDNYIRRLVYRYGWTLEAVSNTTEVSERLIKEICKRVPSKKKVKKGGVKR